MSESSGKNYKSSSLLSLIVLIFLSVCSMLTVYFSLETGLIVMGLKGFSLPARYALLSGFPFIIVLILSAIMFIRKETTIAIFITELTSLLAGTILLYFLYKWLTSYHDVSLLSVKHFFKNINLASSPEFMGKFRFR